MPVLLSNVLLHLEVSAKTSDYQPFSSDCQIVKDKKRAQVQVLKYHFLPADC
jgi:hypothetical protein